MIDPTSVIVAIADAVEAIATSDPEVVRIRASERSRVRALRSLRLLRRLKARLARLLAARGKDKAPGRAAALKARIDAAEQAVTIALTEP